MFFALGSKSHICVIFRDDTMWTTCESGSKDDCDITFLYHGNLFFDEVEEVDGDEPEKEDEWVPTQEDYEHEKEDMALEREGMEGEEVEQDIDVEGFEQVQGYTRRYTYNQLQVRPDNSKQQIDPHILRRTNNAVPVRLVQHGYQTTKYRL